MATNEEIEARMMATNEENEARMIEKVKKIESRLHAAKDKIYQNLLQMCGPRTYCPTIKGETLEINRKNLKFDMMFDFGRPDPSQKAKKSQYSLTVEWQSKQNYDIMIFIVDILIYYAKHKHKTSDMKNFINNITNDEVLYHTSELIKKTMTQSDGVIPNDNTAKEMQIDTLCVKVYFWPNYVNNINVCNENANCVCRASQTLLESKEKHDVEIWQQKDMKIVAETSIYRYERLESQEKNYNFFYDL